MAPLRAILMAMIVAAGVAPASAMDHIVGDNTGWNPKFDYKVWAEGGDFRVGDSITFMYTEGLHNVIRVNATVFESCNYSNSTSNIWSSGFDVLPLASPGEQWYISGIGVDCSKDMMKLPITVLAAAEEPAPAPFLPGSSLPPPHASTAAQAVTPIKFGWWWVLAFAATFVTIKN